MINASLQDFIKVVVATDRITFGDVKRLRRMVLPEGLIARDEVEELLDLDATIARRDPSWTDWLVPAVVDFAVWGERPTGTVEGEAAAWLTELLRRNGMATKAARMIAREIEREADAVDDSLAELAVAAAVAAGRDDEQDEDVLDGDEPCDVDVAMHCEAPIEVVLAAATVRAAA